MEQSVTSQESPETTSSTPKNSNITQLVIVGILMLLIGLGSGYVLFANKSKNENPTVNITTQVTPTSNQEVTPTTQITQQTPTTVKSTNTPQINGAELNAIKYTLPATWEGKISENSLMLSPINNGGYLSIKVYDYAGTTGRREFYCQISKVCIDGTSTFTQMNIGNISGYMASSLDNSGGGTEYFGAKGNKFYIISSFSPPSPNEYDANYKTVLNSLIF